MANPNSDAHTRSPHEAVLHTKHNALKIEIEAERSKLCPDDLKLQNLKRKKLAIKDQL